MSDRIIWATAFYSASHPGMMRVTSGAGIREDVPVPLGLGEAPTLRALAKTPWTGAPGRQWQETSTGVWQVAVYRHATTAPEPGA